jgi:hypothetical protein
MFHMPISTHSPTPPISHFAPKQQVRKSESHARVTGALSSLPRDLHRDPMTLSLALLTITRLGTKKDDQCRVQKP